MRLGKHKEEDLVKSHVFSYTPEEGWNLQKENYEVENEGVMLLPIMVKDSNDMAKVSRNSMQ